MIDVSKKAVYRIEGAEANCEEEADKRLASNKSSLIERLEWMDVDSNLNTIDSRKTINYSLSRYSSEPQILDSFVVSGDDWNRAKMRASYVIEQINVNCNCYDTTFVAEESFELTEEQRRVVNIHLREIGIEEI